MRPCRTDALFRSGRLAAILAAAAGLACAPGARAQLGGLLGGGRNQSATVYQHARIVTMAGPVIEDGSIVVVGGQVRQIGKDVKVPEDATIVDLSGMTVTPGLIDVDGSLGMGTQPPTGPGGRGEQGDPTARAFDGFDRYATDLFKDAVRNGVTVAYISPQGGAGGINGTAAVVRLMPGDGPWAGEVLRDRAALCIDLGSGEPPIQRLQTFDKVRKQFRGALDYREALDTYKEDLEEYEKKVKERADKAAKESGDKGKKEGAAGGAPKPDKAEEKPAVPSPSPSPTPPPAPPKSAADEAVADAGLAQPEPRTPGQPGPQPGGRPPSPAGLPPAGPPAAGQPGDAAKKEEDLKKPTEPTADRKSDVLLRAIDGDMPVRIRCHRSEDILNALELGKEFSLKVAIEGGSEAYLVASSLAESETPVVLDGVIGRDYFRNDELHRRSIDAAALLTRAGVKWHVGTGPSSPQAADRWPSRFVLLSAQLAAQHAGVGVDALRLVTTDAAEFLGISDKAGRLAAGMPADLVVWTGDPLDPGSRVDQVLVGGELLYRAAKNEPREGMK